MRWLGVLEASSSLRDVKGGEAQGSEEQNCGITDRECMAGPHPPGGYSRRDSTSWV